MASIICQALAHGVTRSKRQMMVCRRKAADNGHDHSYLQLAGAMYADQPCRDRQILLATS
jgi:hypothetical protein